MSAYSTKDPGKDAASRSEAGTSIELKLLGQRVAFKSAGDPAQTQAIVELVAGKLAEAEARVHRGGKGVLPQQVALLALLELAEDYLQAKQRTEAHLRQIDEKSERLLQLFDLGAESEQDLEPTP